MDQNELLRIAERYLPGACLGMMPLPPELRMVLVRGEGSRSGPRGFCYWPVGGEAGGTQVKQLRREPMANFNRQTANRKAKRRRRRREVNRTIEKWQAEAQTSGEKGTDLTRRIRELRRQAN
jgi:hypothetical protein